jgi:hypothetical protein
MIKGLYLYANRAIISSDMAAMEAPSNQVEFQNPNLYLLNGNPELEHDAQSVAEHAGQVALRMEQYRQDEEHVGFVAEHAAAAGVYLDARHRADAQAEGASAHELFAEALDRRTRNDNGPIGLEAAMRNMVRGLDLSVDPGMVTQDLLVVAARRRGFDSVEAMWTANLQDKAKTYSQKQLARATQRMALQQQVATQDSLHWRQFARHRAHEVAETVNGARLRGGKAALTEKQKAKVAADLLAGVPEEDIVRHLEAA